MRPTRADIFGAVKVDYKLFTNILGLAIFAALVRPDHASRRHRSRVRYEGRQDQRDPLEQDGKTLYFCSDHCAHAARDQDPEADALTT